LRKARGKNRFEVLKKRERANVWGLLFKNKRTALSHSSLKESAKFFHKEILQKGREELFNEKKLSLGPRDISRNQKKRDAKKQKRQFEGPISRKKRWAGGVGSCGENRKPRKKRRVNGAKDQNSTESAFA